MIRSIRIQNFKSHKDTTIEFGKLTVLCGSNGVGKSSSTQLLLLLREAYLKDRSFNILDLKSNPVKIGTVSDAIYQFGQYDGFSLELLFDNDQKSVFHYESLSESDNLKSFIKLNIEKSTIDFESLSNESLFNENFQYISAARLSPQIQYPKDDKVVDVFKQISVIDGNAEFFVHFLDRYRNNEVIEEICILDDNRFSDLMSQVIAWEKLISEGVNIEIEDAGKLGFLLRYNFATEIGTTKKTKSFEATNVGFGLSYVMPILVAILSANKGALLIIENPEAHLHPKGIAKLTELICIASQAGIQIVVETHSDHVLNGILVQCKKFENFNKGIDKENVSIYQFERKDSEHKSNAINIEVLNNGVLKTQPDDFFDQIEKDLNSLMGF